MVIVNHPHPASPLKGEGLEGGSLKGEGDKEGSPFKDEGYKEAFPATEACCSRGKMSLLPQGYPAAIGISYCQEASSTPPP